MKGLVRKDLKLLAKMDNRIFVIVLYAFAISIAYFGNADIYALQSTLFFSLFLGMHLMMTLTYDGMSSWKEYEMTLPLSVKQIVGSKYLSCLAVLPVSLIGTIVIYLIRWIVYHTFPADLFRISMMFAVIMPLLWCSLCLALAQWIGYMNIQYVRIMGMMLALYLLRGSNSINPGSLTSVLRYPVIIIILLFGIVALSYILCIIGYARKK